MAYYRGDYYRGDYYRGGRARGDYYRGRASGDPFWGALLSGIGAVARGFLGIPKVPTVTSAATPPTFGLSTPGLGQVLNTAISGGFPLGPGSSTNPGVAMIPVNAPKPPSAMIPARHPAAGPPLPAEFQVGGSRSGVVLRKKYRRMNPGNVKALRRSIRRVCSFGKLVNSTKGAIRKAANEVAPVHHSRRALPPARK